MTPNRSYTSVTNNGNRTIAQPKRAGAAAAALAGLTLLALLLRSLRLSWQPLWWDEGYSVYFATEPLPNMLRLTALDIHPPLYYALLHLWTLLARTAAPEIVRMMSVAIGVLAIPAIAWLACTLFPGQRRIAILAALLMALNPMHIFYSQEVRMYGLAMLLSIISTALFWHLIQKTDRNEPVLVPLIAYAVAGTVSLLTLYYLAFLLLAHLIWCDWHFRSALIKTLPLLFSDLLIVLANLAWWLYAVPRLIPYVSDKVTADKDTPLPLFSYLGRHLIAFLGGTVAHPSALPAILAYLTLDRCRHWFGRNVSVAPLADNATQLKPWLLLPISSPHTRPLAPSLPFCSCLSPRASSST